MWCAHFGCAICAFNKTQKCVQLHMCEVPEFEEHLPRPPTRITVLWLRLLVPAITYDSKYFWDIFQLNESTFTIHRIEYYNIFVLCCSFSWWWSITVILPTGVLEALKLVFMLGIEVLNIVSFQHHIKKS